MLFEDAVNLFCSLGIYVHQDEQTYEITYSYHILHNSSGYVGECYKYVISGNDLFVSGLNQ